MYSKEGGRAGKEKGGKGEGEGRSTSFGKAGQEGEGGKETHQKAVGELAGGIFFGPIVERILQSIEGVRRGEATHRFLEPAW
jgi:hypothetical protein